MSSRRRSSSSRSTLFMHQQPRAVARPGLVEHVVHRGEHLVQLALRHRGVGHVHDQVGAERLLERRGERLHQLVRQLADEADGVGEQVAAPGDLERARGRVEGVEQALAHAHVRAGERVQERGLAGVRVPGQRHGRERRRARAPGASCRAWPWCGSRRRRSAEMRSRASRRSVSIWDSPGPRVPMPPSMRPAPRRSRWVQSPRMRARLYSSWASSTWSLPSAEPAWSAKMSRMIAVRSITGTSSSCSRLRSWRGSSSSSHGHEVGAGLLDGGLDLLELAAAEVAVRIRAVAALHHLAGDRHSGRAEQLAQLAQVRLVWAWRRSGTRAGALCCCGCPRRSGSRCCGRRGLCPSRQV